MTGVSFGIDTLFFYPWERTLSADPGRMALTTAISFLLTRHVAPESRGAPATPTPSSASSTRLPLSLALTSLIGYAFQITYVLPFSLGSQMALHTSTAFLAYRHRDDGLRLETCGARPGRPAEVGRRHRRGAAAGAAGRRQRAVSAAVVAESCRSRSCRAIGAVALITLAVRELITATVAYKGLVMIAVPLILLLIFVGAGRPREAPERIGAGVGAPLDRGHRRLAVAADAHRRNRERRPRLRHHR